MDACKILIVGRISANTCVSTHLKYRNILNYFNGHKNLGYSCQNKSTIGTLSDSMSLACIKKNGVDMYQETNYIR